MLTYGEFYALCNRKPVSGHAILDIYERFEREKKIMEQANDPFMGYMKLHDTFVVGQYHFQYDYVTDNVNLITKGEHVCVNSWEDVEKFLEEHNLSDLRCCSVCGEPIQVGWYTGDNYACSLYEFEYLMDKECGVDCWRRSYEDPDCLYEYKGENGWYKDNSIGYMEWFDDVEVAAV